MKIDKENFNTAVKNFSRKSLSATQKENMLLFIREHENETLRTPLPSPYLAFLYRKSFVFGVLFFALISGTSYASASSLPGGALYEVKVAVLEPAMLALTPSEKKEEFVISLFEKRIEELEALKEHGGASARAQEKSSYAAKRNIAAIDSIEKNEEVPTTRLGARIESYNALLAPNLRIEIQPFIKLDASEIEKVFNERVQLETFIEVEEKRFSSPEIEESLLDRNLDSKIPSRQKLDIRTILDIEQKNSVPIPSISNPIRNLQEVELSL